MVRCADAMLPIAARDILSNTSPPPSSCMMLQLEAKRLFARLSS